MAGYNTSSTRPQPRLDADNRAFWTGGANGELLIHRCADCGGYVHPPRPVCRHCLSDKVAPSAVPGTGVVDTFTVNHQKWFPAMEVPFVIARVALDGAPGVYLTTNIVGCPVDAVDIGDKVRVTFEQHGEVWLPLFEKVDA
ncbi:Zn-ribbon domain-containing OB-fold protein [Solimonas terrae]|uniref:DNA-binding protein n=1 Tax=Solimonas terrae TaxID=1396819 RepID=A0A6M2BMR0_9GAMM|nr:DNA-binding protein [Solimonas terrae]